MDPDAAVDDRRLRTGRVDGAHLNHLDAADANVDVVAASRCSETDLPDRALLRCSIAGHRTADVVIGGHAFVQNLRRDQYELAIDTEPMLRLAAAFDELRHAI